MNKNDFIDNALKEHARLENEDDQGFLDELESNLDEGSASEEVVNSEDAGGKKYLWTAVAATVAISAIGLTSLLDQKGKEEAPDLALREGTYSESRVRDSSNPAPENDQRVASLDQPVVKGAKSDNELMAELVKLASPGPDYDDDGMRDLEEYALQTDSAAPPAVVLTPNPVATPGIVVQDYVMEPSREASPKIDTRVASFGAASVVTEPSTRPSSPKKSVDFFYSEVDGISPDASRASIVSKQQAGKSRGPTVRYAEGFGGGFGERAFGIDRQNTGEKYGTLVETGFLSPMSAPLSTFSTDVDTASYSNIRRHIVNGQSINPNAVRIEEMINYFDYQYAQPEGEHPFAVHTEVASCPWNPKHRLVRIGLQGKSIDEGERKAANLVFLLDVSGSMNSPDKLPLLVQSFQILLEELNEEDRVSLVVYAGRQAVLLEPTAIDEDGRTQVAQALKQLRAGGSTAGAAGITTAYDLARKGFIEGGVNRVILATDGDFNVGVSSTDALVELVKNQAEGNISLTVLGFGHGNLNDAMMEKITNSGDGNYFYMDSLREGQKVFQQGLTGTIQTIAKDVKIQVDFNRGKVGQYRLIGYANRRLKDEDFKNDKVDAGDIGAGHRVTALYEIIPVGVAVAEISKYEKLKVVPETELIDSPELLTVKLRYKQPDGDVSTKLEYPLTDQGGQWEESSEDFRFSSGVALWGMLLRNSNYAGGGTPELVSELALGGKGEDVNGERTEMIDLVRRWSSRR